MTNTELMNLAISEAQKSHEPLKCGVVIARNGEVLSAAFNSQRADCNATAHAEIKAIAQAGHKLGSKSLDECEIFCTCEPCTMCLSAILYSKIHTLHYALSLEEVSASHVKISIEEFLERTDRKLMIDKNFMREDALVLFSKNS